MQLNYLALIKMEVREFFERGIVKNYIVPLVDAITKDVINGNSPNFLSAIGNVIEGRIFDRLLGAPTKLVGYLNDSMSSLV